MNVLPLPVQEPSSNHDIIDALRKAIGLAHDASFDSVTIVLKIGEKTQVTISST